MQVYDWGHGILQTGVLFLFALQNVTYPAILFDRDIVRFDRDTISSKYYYISIF